MNIKSKLLRFGFGFLLGIFLLLIMFGDRDFSCIGNYFPQGRVLESIKNKKLIFITKVPTDYQRITDTLYFRNIFLKNASIDFAKSNPRKEPCGEYFISNDSIELLIKNCSKKLEVLELNVNY
ncbi:MAG: hypothetical protein ACK5HU_00405 [Flavobacteriales bacterium]